MISVTQAFRDAMETSTDFKQNAVITLADGTVLNLDEDDFNITGNTIDDSGGVTTFPLGIAICRSITLDIDNSDETFSQYDFYGATINLLLTFKSFTPIAMGLFTVVEPATYGEAIKINAMDSMWKANKTYDTQLDFTSGQSLSQIFIDACMSCGIMVGSTLFPNNAYVVYNKPTNVTYREVLGYVAMLAGGNCRVDRSGYAQIISYTFPVEDAQTGDITNAAYTLENWRSVSLDTDDITITGVAIKDTDGEIVLNGTTGYVIEVTNPLIREADAAGIALIAAVIKNKTFRKFNGQHIGFPIAEFMDCIAVKDRRGNVYGSVLTDFEFTFCGYSDFANSAETKVRNNSHSADKLEEAMNRATAEAVSQARQESEALVTAEKNARETAVGNLSAAISVGGGLYTSSEVLTDGSTVWYLHNKPSIGESNVIVKVNGEAIALSTDGGTNYLYGIRFNGDSITRLLTAEGINADWINTGALTIRDASNNILFQADMDSNSVTISGACVTIGNKTATDVKNTVDELSGYITYQNNQLIIGKNGATTQFVLEDDQISAMLDGEVVSFWNVNEQKTPKQLTIPVGGNFRLGDYQWTPRTTGNVSLLWVGA